MLVIPTQAVPNQTLQANLGGQSCQINVYQTLYGLFMDLYVNGALCIGGVICQNANRIVRNSYLGFLGDLAWYDTQASPTVSPTDPIYFGLGSRYILVYFDEADLLTFQPTEEAVT